MMLGYRIEVTPDDNGTLLITCPQLPIVVSFAVDEATVRANAVDAVETALASMIDDGEDIPHPKGDGLVIHLPALTTLKVNLYWALREAGITRAELSRRLGWNRESVDRLFRLEHKSQLDQLEAAFAALGRHIDIDIREAA